MRGGGSWERYDSAGKTLTTQLNARLPPGNLLTCTFLLDRISSSGLRRLLNQHVGGNLKKVLPRAARTELERVFFPCVTAPEASETRAERSGALLLFRSRSLFFSSFSVFID